MRLTIGLCALLFIKLHFGSISDWGFLIGFVIIWGFIGDLVDLIKKL